MAGAEIAERLTQLVRELEKVPLGLKSADKIDQSPDWLDIAAQNGGKEPHPMTVRLR